MPYVTSPHKQGLMLISDEELKSGLDPKRNNMGNSQPESPTTYFYPQKGRPISPINDSYLESIGFSKSGDVFLKNTPKCIIRIYHSWINYNYRVSFKYPDGSISIACIWK